MDLGLIRGLITIILLLLFIGLWFWSWSSKRSAEFDTAARLPLDNDDQRPTTGQNSEQRR